MWQVEQYRQSIEPALMVFVVRSVVIGTVIGTGSDPVQPGVQHSHLQSVAYAGVGRHGDRDDCR